MSWLSEYLHSTYDQPAASTQPASTPPVKQLATSGFDALLKKGVELFRATPAGTAIEQTATNAKISEITSNPLFIAGLVLGGYLLFTKVLR